MSKHFYFGATVFAILFVYLIEALGVDVKSLLLVGLAFLFALIGAILNELYERRKTAENFERNIRDRLDEVSFELQLMRDCKLDALQERASHLAKTLELIGKISEVLPDKKDEKLKTKN